MGWGQAGCDSTQLVRVEVPGMLDSAPYFPLRVRREVAPLFTEMVRWLVAERRRLGLPPVTSSGGYNKRPVRGSLTEWSNHSWALAGDFNVAANPMQSTLRTDMPAGTSVKARSLGLRWGGDYAGRKDPMHFEFVGTPADAARLVAALSRPSGSLVTPSPATPTPAPPASEEDPMSPEQFQQWKEASDGLRRDVRDVADFLNEIAAKVGVAKRLEILKPTTLDGKVES